jgi:hypothetical protein
VTVHGSGGEARSELTFPPPQLTFACELDRARLARLFADSSVIEDLLALQARVALMCSDFSEERAGVVRRLNSAGVPVAGIPLLPLAEGYYFTVDNADRAAGCYREFMAWTDRHELVWDGVGLDIEPDARIFLQIMRGPWGLVPMLAPRLLDRARPARSKAAYQALVEQIRADGWRAENYQFPLIADERRAGSTLLQRLALADVATDREVWMLYSSFMRALGPGLIWAYGPEAQAIAVGTTGGGPDIPDSPRMPSLTWEELAGICGWPGTFAIKSSSTAWKGASGKASCPDCGPSSGRTSKDHQIARGQPRLCARPCAQLCGAAPIRGRCSAYPPPRPGSPGAGATNDALRQRQNLALRRAVKRPTRRLEGRPYIHAGFDLTA